MPTKAYKLRAEFAESFSGGSVISGPDRGTVDLKELLAEGDGTITTDDVHLQGSLDYLYGSVKGQPVPFFDAHLVDPETGEMTKVERPSVQVSPAAPPRPDLVGVNAPPAMPAEVAGESQEAPQGDGDSKPEHGESGYSGLTLSDLQEIAAERGLKVPKGADEAQIIGVLEDNDDEE